MGEFLIGRDTELSILQRALNDTANGKGGVVLISGERGIGKSAILNALCLRAAALNFRVLRGDCAPRYRPELDPPWIHAICNNLVSTRPNEVDSRWLTDCPTFNEHCEKDDGRAEPLGRPRDRWFRSGNLSFFQSLRQSLEVASWHQPLLLAVDDLQSGDESTLGLIRLANEDFHSRVLLAAAYSSAETPLSSQAFSSGVKSSIGDSPRVELTGLSPDMTGELLTQVLTNEPDEAVTRRIHNLTGGNPWLILETAYSCLWRGSADWSNSFPDRVPAAIRAGTEKRLRGLSHNARELLGFASVIGETFAGQLLLSLVPFGRDAGLAGLSEAEAAGFIRLVGHNCYCFVKGFDKWVLYEAFSSTERASIHQKIAAAMEKSGVQDGEAEAGDVALHLLASRDTNALQRGLEFAQIAGSRSVKASDYQGAIIMYSIALEALDLSEHSDEPRRCDILTRLADAQQRADDIPAAQESLYQAAEIAQRLGDWSRLADIVLAAPPLRWPFPGRPNGLVTMLAERVLSFLPEQDVTRRALLMARWAAELAYFSEERKRSEHLSARAIKMSQREGIDEASKLKLLRLRDGVLRRPELLSERLANSAEVTRIARQLGDWVAVFEGEWAQKVSLFHLGSATDVDNGVETLEHAALMAGSKYHCYILAFRGVQAVFDGRFAEGEQLFATCRETAAACGLTELPDQLWPAIMIPLDEQGRLGELESLVTRWSGTSQTSTLVRVVRCWLAAKLGKNSEARFQLERLAADGFVALKDSRGLLVEAAALTEVCTQLGDVPHHGAVLYQLLRPHEKRNAVLELFASFGAVSRYLGKLALSMSHLDEAIRHLQAAVELNSRMGARAWTAYSSNELALALLARGYSGDLPVALSLLSNAHAEATSMGMERLARTIVSCLDRLEVIDSDFAIEGDSNHHRSRSMEFTATAVQGAAHLVLSPPSNLGRSTCSEKESSSDPPDDGRAPAIFRFERDQWNIAYAGTVIRLGRLKGLDLIAYLLARPNQEIHALELDRLVRIGPPTTPNSVENYAGISDLGPILDDTAKQAYRRRLQELREDLEESRSIKDFERVEKIEEEICTIARELSRAVGLTGRDRKIASETERGRLRVGSAIRWAINKISIEHSALGRLLMLTIKTGTICSYRPDSNDCPNWNL
jgi:hypothetical protein